MFTSAPSYVDNAIWLGLDPADKYPVGIKTPRHLITIAGARSGKGAGLIIPNLRTWEGGSVLVIDPKGENAEHSWRARAEMGQTVAVLDPFGVANVPEDARTSINPLIWIDPKAPDAREEIRVIADGLVMRYNSKDAMWDNGAVTVLAGLIAHVITRAPSPDMKTLPFVRSLLRRTDDDLEEVWQDMADNPAIGGLAQTAASIGLSDAKSAREFVKGARDNTEWLDSPAMADVLNISGLPLRWLRNGRTSLFLVLPPEYLKEHGRFLRLFVRCAINTMARGGASGNKCLFILDEFFSLGHIGEIESAAGLMPSYGVHLWPFLQDLGQLHKLYGKEGAETFFGNADAHIFFGNTDPLTLDHVSIRLGKNTNDDLPVLRPLPPWSPPPIGGDTLEMQNLRWRVWKDHQKDMDEYHREIRAFDDHARQVGQPRFPPEKVRGIVARHDGEPLARKMIVFGTGSNVHLVKPHPYFEPLPEPRDREREAREREAKAAWDARCAEATARRAEMNAKEAFKLKLIFAGSAVCFAAAGAMYLLGL